MLWLALYAAAAAIIAIVAYGRKRLFWLTICFIVNPLVMMTVHATGPEYLLVVALADLAMALIAMALFCWASPAIIGLALTAMMLNVVTYVWYQYPLPYDVFLFFYSWRPHVIRFIELAQLAVLIYYTPHIQTMVRRETTSRKEPPSWMRLMPRPL